jgi:TonB dependent receptor
VGGPIIKDKTFFFLNYEGRRFVTNVTNTSVVPTEEFKSGVFTYTNPATGATQTLDVTTANTGNNATGVGLDPIMQRILALYPRPNVVNPDGVTGELFFPSESREKDEDGTIKVDHSLTKNNNLSARYIYNWFNDPNPTHLDFLPGGLGTLSSHQRTQGLVLSLISTPSGNLSNEVRFGANRTNLFFGCVGVSTFDSFGFVDPQGRGADYALPNISGAGGNGNFGCYGESNGNSRKTGTYQVLDNLTKVVKSHTLKVGGEYRRVYSNNYTDFASRQLFTFDVYSTAGVPILKNLNSDVQSNAIEDMTSALLGLVNYQAQTQFFNNAGAQLVNDNLGFRQRELGIFFQDVWKVRPNLSLTYGLRWEYYGVPFEQHNNLSNLFQNSAGPAPELTTATACAPFSPPCNGFTFSPVGPGTGHQLYQDYYRNFEPRVGFAWDPFRNGRTSVRGGIGVFSDRVYGNLVSDARGNPPYQPSYLAFVDGTDPTAQLQAQGVVPTLTPSPYVLDGSFIFPDLFDPNMKPPRVVSWNFGVQRQLGSNLTVEANYVGNHGTRIIRVVDGNPPQPALVAANLASGTPPDLLQYGNLFFGGPGITSVNNQAFFDTFTDQTTGSSTYHALQVHAQERDFHGLQLGLSYTWSHAIDDSSDPLVTTRHNGNYPVNSYDLSRERGNSGFDTRHRASINFVYQPAIGRGRAHLSQGFAGRVLEGWEISGIAAFQTGLPYDIFGPLDTLHTNGADRATIVNSSILKAVPASGKVLPGGGGVFTGFNAAAFNPEDGISMPIPWGIPSSSLRNSFYGPGVNNWNINLAKTTKITERLNFQLRFEVYNVFNRVQFDKPDNNIADSTFGYSTSQVGQNDGTTGARQIQIGAKINF